jgi:hypothetical protein
MLQRCAGVQVQHIQPADLSPARIWDGAEDRVMRVKDRAVKYYENIRFVYEIETRLKDMQEQQDAASAQQLKKGSTNSGIDHPDGRQAPTRGDKYAGEKKQ